MAKIMTNTNERVFSIGKWLGVNENPSGDMRIAMGEAAKMTNFKITDDGSLQIRGGTQNMIGVLSGYDIAVSDTATVLLTELNVSTKVYTLYSDVTVGTDGRLAVSGTGVSVTSTNASSYSGYFYQDTNGNMYKLANCTLTRPSTGTLVTGGSINIGTDETYFYCVSYGSTVATYDSLKVVDGKVSGTGNVAYSFGPKYAYCIPSEGYAFQITRTYQNGYNNLEYYGYSIGVAGNDTYAWNFKAVTLAGTSTDTEVRGLWSGRIAKTEDFTGNGSTTAFTLSATGLEISKITVDDAAVTAYTYASSTGFITFTTAPVSGANIRVTEDSTEYLISACNGKLWRLVCSGGEWTRTSLGSITTTNGRVHMFGFDQKLYIMDGSQYYVYDGTTLLPVEGYRPLVVTASVPSGGGTALEKVNKLNGERRVRFSPTGTAVLQLTETGLSSIDYVKNLSTGIKYTPTTDYTADAVNGRVTFVSSSRTENFTGNSSNSTFTLANNNVNVTGITIAGTSTTAYTYNMLTKKIVFTSVPANGAAIVVTETITPVTGTNTVEVGYTYPTNFRSQVTKMRYSETYNGETDTRVFLFGDGSNRVIYSGLDTNGSPRADYFPDLNEVAFDSANTPVTAMIKHFDRLLTFKSDGAFITTYGTITLSDGTTTTAFYTSPLNREIGHEAAGQVVLINNNPFTLFGRSVYEWRLSSYTSKDERTAKSKGQRVVNTLSDVDFSDAVCFDDIFHSEYYIVQNGTAIVYNYNVDVWYVYTEFPATCIISYGQEVYFGTSDGYIRRFSRDYMNDNGTAITAYWESGSMSFGADYKRKYSASLWVGLKPEKYGALNVSVQTDRQNDYTDESLLSNYTEDVASGFFNFLDLDFSRFSFGINDKPQMKCLKIKVKKFDYYKLIFTSQSTNTTATVTGADIRVRYTGNVR